MDMVVAHCYLGHFKKLRIIIIIIITGFSRVSRVSRLGLGYRVSARVI